MYLQLFHFDKDLKANKKEFEVAAFARLRIKIYFLVSQIRTLRQSLTLAQSLRRKQTTINKVSIFLF